jgi:mannosyltransferase OCH1-like enzyme
MQIPKIIWQTSAEPYEELPEYIRIMTETWKEMNPEWDYQYVTNHDAGQWILDTYGTLYKDMYDYITVPFCKADFWRYLVLKINGGLYVDIDTVCLEPIDSWIDSESQINLCTEWFEEFGKETYGQWLIACTPGNKFINSMISDMRAFIAEAKAHQIPISPSQTGPGPWTDAINEVKESGGLNLIDIGGKVHHYVGNSSWSDSSGHTMESTIWDIKKHDAKLLNVGYNSIGDEKLWA